MTNRGPFKITGSREVYHNRWLRIREDQVIRPDGSAGIFGLVEMKSGSSVIAIDRDFNLVLGKEFKYGINRESLETLSGAIEEGETPLEAAKRELEEETGNIASEWIDLGVIDPFTTVIHSPNYMFLAMKLSAGTVSLDPGEIVDVVSVPFREAIRMVLDSRITHGASCVGILKAARYLQDHGLLTDLPTG